ASLSDPVDVAFRVVADHLRMAAFAIADGAKPDNKGRGSVVRSVIRRAVRFVWQQFKVYQPFIHELVDTLVRQMGDVFPELKAKKHAILTEIQFEEAGFIHTIHQGLDLYEEARLRARQAGKRISGEDVFHLHTTYGFPPDLTRQMAMEAGFTIDEKRYHELLSEHEEKSRGKVVGGQVALNISGGLPATDDRAKWFTRTCEAEVVGCWPEKGGYLTEGPVPADQQSGLLLDKTCFYAEQ